MASSSKDMNKEMKMDWMYKDSSQVVDPEEYLLGRKVDKQFEKSSLPPDKDQEPLPTSIFSLSVIENQVDIARKLQEDPLYLIKKKEIESREQLLKNPRKMKQLQEMVVRQQAAAEKLRKKQRKKDKKLKKSKDLDALLANKCKAVLGGFDMKKLVALESDTNSESSSNDRHKYKKMKKREDLDKLLALKYKKLLGKVDPKTLVEMNSSSSDSDSSSGDKNTKKNRTQNMLSSSENESSSNNRLKKEIRGSRLSEEQYCLYKDGSRSKKIMLKSDSKTTKTRDSTNDIVGSKIHNSNYKDRKSKYRSSSSDSQVSYEEKKQKLHYNTKTSNKSRDFSSNNSAKDYHHERYKSKRSEQRIECDERRSRHEGNSRVNTNHRSTKSKKIHESHGAKESTRSNTEKLEKGDSDYSNESSSYNSCSKQKIKKRDPDEHRKKISKEMPQSNSLCNESRSKNQKLYEKSGKSKDTKRNTKLTSSSSSSDSDTSFNNGKINQKKQYGLVLPANYVPKKTPVSATEKILSEEKNKVKPIKREEKRKLTDKEKEERLKEMMNNAKWRDDLRDTNIKTYKKKLEAEKDNYVYKEDFMRNQMSYAMSQGTVESRVKAKINTIQRSKEAMSENFARRK